MDIKICDKCGNIINKSGYQLETSSNTTELNIGISFDLCPDCHEEINDFIQSAKKVKLGVVEENFQEGKVPCVNWCVQDKRWRVVIYVKGKQKYVGQHSEYTEAVCLLLAVEQCLGMYEGKPPSEAEMHLNILLNSG